LRAIAPPPPPEAAQAEAAAALSNLLCDDRQIDCSAPRLVIAPVPPVPPVPPPLLLAALPAAGGWGRCT
jgi:hypothetical protein